MGKIIDSVWFDKIGIVKVDTGYETKWYKFQGLIWERVHRGSATGPQLHHSKQQSWSLGQ